LSYVPSDNERSIIERRSLKSKLDPMKRLRPAYSELIHLSLENTEFRASKMGLKLLGRDSNVDWMEERESRTELIYQ
jgi:hypothetical protein